MQFRDLRKQYQVLKTEMDQAMAEVLESAGYISGRQVTELEEALARYVGVKHCITCANGTDALTLALMSWGIGEGDAVFVPDFTFFSSAETVAYEDGGAVFTDSDDWAALIRSLRIHGKGSDKYDNVRIGMNSRLDTLQAAVLLVKLKAFQKELADTDAMAEKYAEGLKDCVKVPVIPEGCGSGWAQYSILLRNGEERDRVQAYLKANDVPSMIYYQRGMQKRYAAECFRFRCRLT